MNMMIFGAGDAERLREVADGDAGLDGDRAGRPARPRAAASAVRAVALARCGARRAAVPPPLSITTRRFRAAGAARAGPHRPIRACPSVRHCTPQCRGCQFRIDPDGPPQRAAEGPPRYCPLEAGEASAGVGPAAGLLAAGARAPSSRTNRRSSLWGAFRPQPAQRPDRLAHAGSFPRRLPRARPGSRPEPRPARPGGWDTSRSTSPLFAAISVASGPCAARVGGRLGLEWLLGSSVGSPARSSPPRAAPGRTGLERRLAPALDRVRRRRCSCNASSWCAGTPQ